MSKERIMVIIKDIERYFSDLEGIESGIRNVSDLKSREKFYAVSMILFSAVNRSFDLGEEIISHKNLGFPEKYRDIFYLLERGGIIDENLYKELLELVRFRNLAAHEYFIFTEDDVFRALKKISAIKRFVEAVREDVKKWK